MSITQNKATTKWENVQITLSSFTYNITFSAMQCSHNCCPAINIETRFVILFLQKNEPDLNYFNQKVKK